MQIEGHPDLVAFGLKTEQQVWGFTGPIARRSDLVHVLATIAWLASGHHAGALNCSRRNTDALLYLLGWAGLQEVGLHVWPDVREPACEPAQPISQLLSHSCLSAAVNFGQYDFTGLVLNASSLVRRPMPAPGDAAYQVGACVCVCVLA